MLQRLIDSTPYDENTKEAEIMSREKIIRNRARCLVCGDIIESTYRHDFVQCTCGNVFVDGGLDYIRRGFVDGASFEELSETEPRDAPPTDD